MSIKDKIKQYKDNVEAAKTAAQAANEAAKTAKGKGDANTANTQKEFAKTKAKDADNGRKEAQNALIEAVNAAQSDTDLDDIHAAATDVVALLSSSASAVVAAKDAKKSVEGEGSDDDDDFLKDFDKHGNCQTPRPVTECINCNTDNKPGIALGCCFKWSVQSLQDLNKIKNAGGVISWNSACSGRTVICGGTGVNATQNAINVLNYLKALGFIVA